MPRILGAIALLSFALLVANLGALTGVDARAAAAVDAIHATVLTVFLIWLSRHAAHVATALVVVAVVAAFRRGADGSEVWRVLLSLAGSLLLIEGLKLLIYRDRPGGSSLHPLASNGFPSGHVAHAALCVAAATALAWPRHRLSAFRFAVTAAGVLFVALVAFTRVYLGLHWLSDVAGSLLLGVSFAGMVRSGPVVGRGALYVLAFVLPAIYLTVAYGVHVTVPSPDVRLPARTARSAPHRPQVPARS